MSKVPCYGCEVRTVTCKFDGTCTKYDDWNKEHQTMRENRRRDMAVHCAIIQHSEDMRAKAVRARR